MQKHTHSEQLGFFDFPKIPLFEHPLWEQVSKSVRTEWYEFHLKNPHVFALFTFYANEIRDVGWTRYGAKSIVERLRWHVSMKNVGNEFKMCNSFTSMYARLLAISDPRFETFFEFREGSADE